MKLLCETCGALAEAVLRAGPGGASSVACSACGAEQALPEADAPAASPPSPPAPPEAEAWARVLERWGDEATHRAYLAGFSDLEGLAAAGRRYRDALAERPGDPVALRWREEVLKRAAVQGLAQLPRSAPPPAIPRNLRRALLAGLGAAAAGAGIWIAWQLLGAGRVDGR